MRIPKTVIQFRLYPWPGSRLYFEARVYATKRPMLAAIRRNDNFLGQKNDWSGTGALCRTFYTQRREGRRWVTLPRIGILFFHRGCFGTEVVAHEVTHAAIGWARRIRLTGQAVFNGSRGEFESTANERFCYVVGKMNRDFWRQWYARQRSSSRRRS